MTGNDDLSKKEVQFREHVAAHVTMLANGLKTYGKSASGSMVDAWMMVLPMAEVTMSEMKLATAYFLANADEMPTPGEYARWIVAERKLAKARAACRNLERECRELRQQKRAALRAQGIDPDAPVSDDQRKALMEQIDRLGDE